MKKTIAKILTFVLVAVMVCIVLVSCDAPNSDPSKALQALKDNGYTAEKLDDAISLGAMELLGIKDVTALVSGTAKKDGKVESVSIIYFENKEAADAEWDDVKKLMDEEKDDDSNWVIKKSGSMIYFGTEAGIKAAK